MRITITLSDSDAKLVRRLARHDHRSPAGMARALVSMSLQAIRTEEHTGWCYGPEPRVPHMPVMLLPAPRSPCHAWSKQERDHWILTGEGPAGDDGMSPNPEYPRAFPPELKDNSATIIEGGQ